MAGVHTVNAVELDIFRRDFEDVLHRLFGGYHFLHQLKKCSIWGGVNHERFAKEASPSLKGGVKILLWALPGP